MLFTNHKTRITDLIAVLFAVAAPGRRKKSQHKNRRPVTASLRPFAWQGAASRGKGRSEQLSAPATRPVGFSRDTRHETRFFPVPPATPRRATPRPANGFFTNHETRNTNHGLYRRPDRRARRPLTTSLRISTRPFLDILGLLPPDYVFLPPDYDFFRIITILLPTIPQNSSEFLGILRITPRAGVRAPSAVLARLPGARRQPPLPPPSGLLPLRRKKNEPC